MEMIDLINVPVVDNHCHGLYRDQTPADLVAWRAHFTESADPEMRQEHVVTTLFYRHLIRELAAFLGCPADEAAVLAARGARDRDEIIRLLLGAANIDVLLIDQGYPPAEHVLPDAEVARIAGCRVAPILDRKSVV